MRSRADPGCIQHATADLSDEDAEWIIGNYDSEDFSPELQVWARGLNDCLDFSVEAPAPADGCETVRSMLEVAVEAHWATFGEGPSNQEELLNGGFISAVEPDFVISSDGNGVLAAPASRCQ